MKSWSVRPVVFLLMICSMASASADDALWQKLKTQENLVIFMRHAYSEGGNPLFWDSSGYCRNESRLNDAGKLLAHKIGNEFLAHQLNPRVISSPMCRCLETAQIAFHEQSVSDPLLREIASADEQGVTAFEEKARVLISDMVGLRPVVFVSHRPNINQLTMELIAEGELLVAEVSEEGEIEVLGKIALN